jgi:hypothetical protein
MASRTLEHFGFTPFHLEYFGMAVSTFKLMLGNRGLMAKRYRPRTPSRFKLDIATAYFFLLSIAHAPPSSPPQGGVRRENQGEGNLFIAAGNKFTRRRRNSSRKKGGKFRRHGFILKEIADYSGIHYTGASKVITKILLSKKLIFQGLAFGPPVG